MAKAKSWEAEFARKCQRLEPKVIGCIWIQPQNTPPGEKAQAYSKEELFLMQFSAVALVPLPIPVPVSSKGESSTDKMETPGLEAGLANGVNHYVVCVQDHVVMLNQQNKQCLKKVSYIVFIS